MNSLGKWIVSGIALLSVCILVPGCNSAGLNRSAVSSNSLGISNQTNKVSPSFPTSNPPAFPTAPYVYKSVQTSIVSSASWNHITNSFGYSDKMIVNHESRWLPLSFIELSMNGSGIPNSLKGQILNFQVPASISVGPFDLPAHVSIALHELEIAVNGHPVALLPWFKSDTLSQSYVPMTQVLNALGSIHMPMRWKPATAQNPADWDIGSPVYGTVTTITTMASGHATRTMSNMSILHAKDNWIPYDYIVNSLDNTQAGISVSTLGQFAGINITVPPSIQVNMNQLPAQGNPPKNKVPIEINGRVVGYAFSLVPTFGTTTGYLSSAEVMTAIRRIGLSMHWNNTNGTFTRWHITAPSPSHAP